MTERSGAVGAAPAYVPQSPWGPTAAVAVAILASLVPAIAVTAAVAWINLDGPRSLSSPLLLAQMTAGQILSLLLIWWAAGRGGMRAQVLRLKPVRETPAVVAVGFGLLLVAAVAPVELLLYRLAGLDLFTDGRWLLEGLRSDLWWAVVFAAVVLAPLWEELTFRGFVLSALAKSRLGFWPGAAISSVLWTGLHAGYSWPGLVSVFLAGLGLAWIMKRTGSMKAVVIAHAAINAFALAVVSTFA